MKLYFKILVSNLSDKTSNPIVNKIDEQLKEIARKLQKQTDEIDSICRKYFTNSSRNKYLFHFVMF